MHRHVPASGRVRIAVAVVLALVIALWAPGTAVAAESGLRERNGFRSVSTADTSLSFGQWTSFNIVDRAGSFNLEGAFTFWSRHPVLLRVTDGFCRGDRFRVYDRGWPIFLTSKVAIDPSCDDIPFVTSPFTAWQDQTYSKGRFLLQPGFHRVRIQIVTSPFGGASAWLHASQQPVG
jgi:hypothetical protein